MKKLYAILLTLMMILVLAGLAVVSAAETPHRTRGGRGNFRAIMQKYRDDPEFKQMMQELKTLRQEVRSEMQKYRSSGARPDPETIKSKRAEFENKFNAVKNKYGSKFPDFFAEVEKMKRQRKQRRQKRMNDPDRKKMQEVMKKYEDDPDFKKMMEEIRSARSSMRGMRRGRKRTGSRGSRPNPGEMRKKRQEMKQKMEAIEAKYGSKFPDFFSTAKEIRKSRMEKHFKKNPGMKKMFEARQKYQSDPDFQKMTNELRSIRQEMRKEMQSMRSSGMKNTDRTERMNKMNEFRAKFDAVKAKYQSKFPDFFEAIEELRNNRKNRRGRRGGGRRNRGMMK